MKHKGLADFLLGKTGAELAVAVTRGELPQRADENAKQYAAFVAYCQSEGKATLEQIAKRVGRSQPWLSRLRARKRWDERIMAWQQGPGSASWQQRQEELRHEEWALHKKLIDSGHRLIDKWEDSEELPSIGDLTKMIELACKLGRMAAGLPLDGAEIPADPNAAFRLEIQTALARAYGPEANTQGETIIDVEEVPVELTCPHGSVTTDQAPQTGDHEKTDPNSFPLRGDHPMDCND